MHISGNEIIIDCNGRYLTLTGKPKIAVFIKAQRLPLKERKVYVSVFCVFVQRTVQLDIRFFKPGTFQERAERLDRKSTRLNSSH